MTNSPVVTEATLGGLDLLSDDGGQAEVLRLPGYRLPGSSWELLYKRYSPGATVDPDPLRRLVTWRQSLNTSVRKRLDDSTSWPLQIVQRGQRVVGVVIRRAPAEFTATLTPAAGTRQTRLREAQYLFTTDAKVAKLGLTPLSDAQRVAVCQRFAEFLQSLHAAGLVYGDVSSRNVLFALSPARTFVIDCDGAAPTGTIPATGLYQTLDWDDPAALQAARWQADVYKLGLFVLRAASRSFVTRDPSGARPLLDASGVDLLKRSLNTNAARRPPVTDWVEYLDGRRGKVSAKAPTTTVAVPVLPGSGAQPARPAPPPQAARPSPPPPPVPPAPAPAPTPAAPRRRRPASVTRKQPSRVVAAAVAAVVVALNVPSARTRLTESTNWAGQLLAGAPYMDRMPEGDGWATLGHHAAVAMAVVSGLVLLSFVVPALPRWVVRASNLALLVTTLAASTVLVAEVTELDVRAITTAAAFVGLAALAFGLTPPLDPLARLLHTGARRSAATFVFVLVLAGAVPFAYAASHDDQPGSAGPPATGAPPTPPTTAPPPATTLPPLGVPRDVGPAVVTVSEPFVGFGVVCVLATAELKTDSFVFDPNNPDTGMTIGNALGSFARPTPIGGGRQPREAIELTATQPTAVREVCFTPPEGPTGGWLAVYFEVGDVLAAWTFAYP